MIESTLFLQLFLILNTASFRHCFLWNHITSMYSYIVLEHRKTFLWMCCISKKKKKGLMNIQTIHLNKNNSRLRRKSLAKITSSTSSRLKIIIVIRSGVIFLKKNRSNTYRNNLLQFKWKEKTKRRRNESLPLYIRWLIHNRFVTIT